MSHVGKKHILWRSTRSEEVCITRRPDGHALGDALKFDPRTELLLLVLANVVAFTQHSPCPGAGESMRQDYGNPQKDIFMDMDCSGISGGMEPDQAKEMPKNV